MQLEEALSAKNGKGTDQYDMILKKFRTSVEKAMTSSYLRREEEKEIHRYMYRVLCK